MAVCSSAPTSICFSTHKPTVKQQTAALFLHALGISCEKLFPNSLCAVIFPTRFPTSPTLMCYYAVSKYALKKIGTRYDLFFSVFTDYMLIHC